MNNKYYHPTIEEFCIGFRYEMKCKADMWFKEVVIKETFTEAGGSDYTICLPFSEEDLLTHEIRTKLLDQEDIEELGFKFKSKSIWSWYTLEKQFRLSSGHWINKITLIHDRENSFINEKEDICQNIKINASISGSEDILFEGTIKNYNELERLLKQIGVVNGNNKEDNK